MRRPLGIILAVFAALVVVSTIVRVVDPGGTPRVAEVPKTLPAKGVDIGGGIVLKPLADPPAHMLAKAVAIEKARHHATDKPFPATALEASVTVPGNSRVQNAPAWVVTFTSPKPTNVSQGGKPVYVSNYSVVLDATTGKYLVGFFTK